MKLQLLNKHEALFLSEQLNDVLQVCAEEHQRYLLFSSLLRHTASGSISTVQQAALVNLAAAEGRALEAGLASPALVLAIKVYCLAMPTYVTDTANMYIVASK